MPENIQTVSRGQPGLVRALGLGELIIYGLVLIQPTAPMPLYGAVVGISHGHVVTTILIGMVAMLFTAMSYGRMARAYPNAGSAYTYVGRELHPALGYLTGWSMLFDYVVNPIICVIWCSKAAINFVPQIPYVAWIVIFTALFTGLNLRGIKSSARTTQLLAAGLGTVVVLFFGAAIRYLWHEPNLTTESFLRPFYDPQTFSFAAISSGTAMAVLTYIGFDGISTLSEEVHNPRRNIFLATVLVCLLIGILSAVEVYLAQMVWPSNTGFPDADTAFVFIAGKAGGQWLFFVMNLALLVANMGSGMGAHLGASRLLYGMGRDNAIPRRFFGVVNPKTHIPSNNILLIGGVVLVGAFIISYPLGAEMLNFGALIAFMGVNMASFIRYYVRGEARNFSNLVPPLLGFVICLYIWLSLGSLAKIIGFVWLATGFLYGAWKTNWYRNKIEGFDPADSEENSNTAEMAN